MKLYLASVNLATISDGDLLGGYDYIKNVFIYFLKYGKNSV